MLKAITREQLLGNYGKLSSYVLLYLLFEFTISNLIMIIEGGFVMQLLATLIGNILISVFEVGFIRVCLHVSRGEPYSLKDFFYVIKHDPDKVIIIASILWFFQTLIFIPVYIPGSAAAMIGLTGGALVLVRCVLITAFIIIYLLVYIRLSQSYLIYLDRPELGAVEILTLSDRVMKNNKMRYFYLLFNVFGMMCLTALTLGIAVFWMLPCMNVLAVNFYEDLRGGLRAYDKISGVDAVAVEEYVENDGGDEGVEKAAGENDSKDEEREIDGYNGEAGQ